MANNTSAPLPNELEPPVVRRIPPVVTSRPIPEQTATDAAGMLSPRFETPTSVSAESVRDKLPVAMEPPPQLASTSAVGDSERQPPTDANSTTATEPANESPVRKRLAWYQWPGWFMGRSLDFASLTILLAVVAAIPIVQFASLGYLLNSATRLSRGERWSASLPGLRLAGKVGTFALLAALSWLPVWLVTDLSYSAQLLQPGSGSAAAWRFGAFAITFAWVTHVGWAAMRGGRWWHFLWPAPLKFLLNIWRPATWGQSSEALYDSIAAFQFPKLWWIGARGALGALIWTAVPVSMMIVGLRAQDFQAAALVGLIGAIAMTVIMMYLPFLQIQLAKEDRFVAVFDVRQVRRRFLYAPWAHTISLLLLCVLCIPLYLLRIEATPAELLWAPSLVFVLFMLPAKLLLGAAMGYAETREHRKQLAVRHWISRWPARILMFASALIYVGALYIAQLVAGQGAFVMYFQHAFLVPAPLISS